MGSLADLMIIHLSMRTQKYFWLASEHARKSLGVTDSRLLLQLSSTTLHFHVIQPIARKKVVLISSHVVWAFIIRIQWYVDVIPTSTYWKSFGNSANLTSWEHMFYHPCFKPCRSAARHFQRSCMESQKCHWQQRSTRSSDPLQKCRNYHLEIVVRTCITVISYHKRHSHINFWWI